MKEWLKQMFVYPQIEDEEVDYDKYWNDKRGQHIGVLSDWQKLRANYIVRVLGKGSFSFVDIGCGDGSILNYLRERGIVSEATGIDMSGFALEQMRVFGFKFLSRDIRDKKFLKEIPPSDYVLMFEILEHIEHSELMLKNAYNKSLKGVFFSFPNTGFFVHRFRLLFGRFPLQWRLFPGEHLRFWTKKDLIWWLKSLGFKNYEIYHYKGIPILNTIWPSMFAAGFVVFVPK